MAAVVVGDFPSHLFEIIRNHQLPFFLAIIGNEKIYVHAGNINELMSPIGGTLLHSAVRNDDIEKVRPLLRCGADVNVGDYAGSTPLMVSCARGVTLNGKEIFHLLLENGADVNARDSDGYTALHVSRNQSQVKELLERGANVNARSHNGWTPLDMNWRGRSTLPKHNPIVRELLRWGAEIEKRNEKAVFLLVQDKACSMESIRRTFQGTEYTDSRDEIMRTPLHYAVRTGRAELVRVLLECGASVGARSSQGYTPLHTAVAFDCGVEVVSELIREGADVNAKTGAGDTCLHLAFLSVNAAVVELLLSSGADPDALQRVPSNHPGAPLLLRRSVLRNYASRVEYTKSAPWRQNFLTCIQCMSEIEDMRRTRLSKDLTLYDVAFGDKWDMSCARKAHKFISSGDYPMYSELVLPKLARNVKKDLSDGAKNNSLFLHNLSKKSSFRTNQHVLQEIVKYLSNDDCLSLYIAGC